MENNKEDDEYLEYVLSVSLKPYENKLEKDEQEEESIIFRRGVIVVSEDSDVVEDIVYEDT